MRGFSFGSSLSLVLALLVAGCGVKDADQVEKVACVESEVPSLEGQSAAEFVEARRPQVEAAIAGFFKEERQKNVRIDGRPGDISIGAYENHLAPKVIEALGFRARSICQLEPEKLTILGLVLTEFVKDGVKQYNQDGGRNPDSAIWDGVRKRVFIGGMVDHVLVDDTYSGSFNNRLAFQIGQWAERALHNEQTLQNNGELDEKQVRQELEEMISELEASRAQIEAAKEREAKE